MTNNTIERVTEQVEQTRARVAELVQLRGEAARAVEIQEDIQALGDIDTARAYDAAIDVWKRLWRAKRKLARKLAEQEASLSRRRDRAMYIAIQYSISVGKGGSLGKPWETVKN